MPVWTVKAGAKGEAEPACLTHGLIGKGGKVPDLSNVASRNEISALWSKAYPEASAATTANHAGQLWSLVKRLQEGELVVLPLKTTGTIAVGEVKGPYQYRTDLVDTLVHVRPVKWLRTDLARDAFDQDLLFSFGAFITIGRVRREKAEERILAVVGGSAVPTPSDEAEADSVETAPDIDALAREQVRQHISQHIAGHDLAHLVSEVLKARGLEASESQPGPDRGVDILAGSGPLGLDSPRLAVQVKTGTAGVDEFRALRGVMEDFRAEQGLLVAWGGFKGKVREEARHAHFSIRLWDADELLNELFAVYEQLPGDLRSGLPLKRTWTLVLPAE
jgi:restriction system protein